MKVKINTPIRKLIGILVLSLLLSSCVEEYWPELKEVHDGSLVVDGKITNQAGPYTVKLSHAISFQDSVFRPKVGATVKIIDSEGNVEVLLEALPGEYQTSNQDFIGIIGRSYKVQIVTANGKEYESEFEELKNPTQIESVTYEEKEEIIDETVGSTVKGFQFYVSSELSENAKDYFYWEVEETYEHHADFYAEWYYEGVKDYTSDGPISTPRATDFHKTLHDCWTTDNIRNFFTFSTEQLSTPKVDNKPLHFVEYRGDKLKIGYSLLVKQYSISEQAHLFLKGLQEQNSDQNNFYTNQPYQVSGNISNVSDPEEAVLGYFMAAGTSEPKRIFTRRPYGEIAPPPRYKISCGLYKYNSPFLPNTLYTLVNTSPAYMWPLYFATIDIENSGADGKIVILTVVASLGHGCIDCRLKGGSTTKPDFWIKF